MGVLGRISFSWINKIVSHARNGKLSEDNMPLPSEQEADPNFSVFQREWEAETAGKSKDEKPSLLEVLRRIYGTEFMWGGFFKLCWSFFVIMGAFFFVRSLLLSVDPEKESPYDSDLAGYLLMAFFFVDAYFLGILLSFLQRINSPHPSQLSEASSPHLASHVLFSHSPRKNNRSHPFSQ
jgi:ATP-binding cassette, subfamily C (CFTR/MRP), member 1